MKEMFRFVKNWLHHTTAEPSAAQPFAPPEFHPRSTARPQVSAIVERADSLALPLAAVFSRLPQDLQGRVRLPVNPDATVCVALSIVLSQLGRGAVKISFGELRQFCPPETFYSQTDNDAAVVELPLGEILARLKPEQLPRRAQRSASVPEEITSPFAERGAGLSFYKPESPVVSTPRPQEQDPYSAAPEFPARGRITTVPPTPPVSTPSPASAAIPAPAGLRESVPPPATRGVVLNASQSGRNNGETLPVQLAELNEGWPTMVREEIVQLGLSHAIVLLPMQIVGDALKLGRAMFSWKQIRTWTNSPVAVAAVSQHDAELLELPLKVIAPLFFAKQRPARPQPKAVMTDIPNLFSASPKSIPNPARAMSVNLDLEKPAPIIFSDNEVTGKVRFADSPRTGTEFIKRQASPNDIVGRAASFEGVVGALVTLADGLLVASHLPPNVDGDQLAAFMPQVFSRISQSAREFRMGELRDLTFTVGVTPWKIFKVGSVFFAAFGNDQKPLPAAQLSQLAAELDRKPKP